MQLLRKLQRHKLHQLFLAFKKMHKIKKHSTKGRGKKAKGVGKRKNK